MNALELSRGFLGNPLLGYYGTDYLIHPSPDIEQRGNAHDIQGKKPKEDSDKEKFEFPFNGEIDERNQANEAYKKAVACFRRFFVQIYHILLPTEDPYPLFSASLHASMTGKSADGGNRWSEPRPTATIPLNTRLVKGKP